MTFGRQLPPGRYRKRPRWSALALLIVALLPGAHTVANDGEPIELTVVSFNVLVDLGKPAEFPSWKERRELCVAVLADANADLIGLQEPTPGQLGYLLQELPGYQAHYYRKRDSDPGYTDAVLLYREEVFDVLETGHWWLSPTPDRVSTGFGNVLPRLLVWAELLHGPSQRRLFAFNTHFDNSLPSQTKMAALCQERLAAFAERQRPMIWMGDFNTDQKRGDYSTLVSAGWHDAYVASPLASEDGRDENVATFFNGTRIDHILYHGSGIQPIEWRRLESPDPQRLLSDHYPILARLRIE